MLLSEYLPSHCDTAGLAGLTKQIATQFFLDYPLAVSSVESAVQIAGPTTIPFLQPDAAAALRKAIERKGEKPRLVHALRVLPQQAAVSYWYLHGREVRSSSGSESRRVSARTRRGD